MAVVVYNGVNLPYAEHTNFLQEAVRDDFSDTDWILTKFNIAVQSVIHVDYLPLIAPDLFSNAGVPYTRNPADIMNVIRTRLLQHRKSLSVSVNGRELIPKAAGQVPGTVDADNGPKPQSCTIYRMNNVSFLITYHVIAHYWERNTDPTPDATKDIVTNQFGNDVLYNKWTESVDIDSANYTLRMREGKFRIRSDNVNGKTADEIRDQMAVLSVPSGFLRVSAHYTVTPDGLAIKYRIVDKEVFKKPPYPAFEARGEYIESSSNNDAIRYAEVRVMLRGSKTTNQAQLILRAVAVAASKLALNGADLIDPNKDDRAIPIGAAVRVDMYNNEVEAIIKAQFASNEKRIKGIAFLSRTMAFTPFSERTTPTPQYTSRGTAQILLQAAAHYDPSLVNNNIAQGVLQTAGKPRTIGDAEVQLQQGFEVGQAGKTREP